MENLAVTGSADISLFGETRDDLTKNKTFDGGSMTITNRAPFSVDASVYEEDDDAYTNTEGNSERLWEVRPEDEEVYLGTLTYTNDFLEPIDFGETAVGSIIDITLDTPAQGKLRGNGNFFLDIDQEREGAETLELGFRGKDPNNFEFISTDGETTGVIPYRFDFVGGRISGSGEEIDPSFTFTVEDDSTVSVDLYGRVFALDTGELPVSDGGDSGSEGITPIDAGEDEPDTEIEDGTDSEADDTITDGEAEDTTVDDSSDDETPIPEDDTDSDVGEDDSGDTDTPVDTDTDTPDTEEGVGDSTDSEPDDTATNTPTILDTIEALQDQIDGLQPIVDQGIISQEILDDLESQIEDLLDTANGDGSDSPDETQTPEDETDSEVGEDNDPVNTETPEIEEGMDSEPNDITTDQGVTDNTNTGDDNPTVDDSSDATLTPDSVVVNPFGETVITTDGSDLNDINFWIEGTIPTDIETLGGEIFNFAIQNPNFVENGQILRGIDANSAFNEKAITLFDLVTDGVIKVIGNATPQTKGLSLIVTTLLQLAKINNSQVSNIVPKDFREFTLANPFRTVATPTSEISFDNATDSDFFTGISWDFSSQRDDVNGVVDTEFVSFLNEENRYSNSGGFRYSPEVKRTVTQFGDFFSNEEYDFVEFGNDDLSPEALAEYNEAIDDQRVDLEELSFSGGLTSSTVLDDSRSPNNSVSNLTGSINTYAYTVDSFTGSQVDGYDIKSGTVNVLHYDDLSFTSESESGATEIIQGDAMQIIYSVPHDTFPLYTGFIEVGGETVELFRDLTDESYQASNFGRNTSTAVGSVIIGDPILLEAFDIV